MLTLSSQTSSFLLESLAATNTTLEVADGAVANIRACLEEAEHCVGVGGVRADSISVFSYSSLSNCFVSFLELELEVIDYREGVDEVVAFVHA